MADHDDDPTMTKDDQETHQFHHHNQQQQQHYFSPLPSPSPSPGGGVAMTMHTPPRPSPSSASKNQQQYQQQYQQQQYQYQQQLRPVASTVDTALSSTFSSTGNGSMNGSVASASGSTTDSVNNGVAGGGGGSGGEAAAAVAATAVNDMAYSCAVPNAVAAASSSTGSRSGSLMAATSDHGRPAPSSSSSSSGMNVPQSNTAAGSSAPSVLQSASTIITSQEKEKATATPTTTCTVVAARGPEGRTMAQARAASTSALGAGAVLTGTDAKSPPAAAASAPSAPAPGSAPSTPTPAAAAPSPAGAPAPPATPLSMCWGWRFATASGLLSPSVPAITAVGSDIDDEDDDEDGGSGEGGVGRCEQRVGGAGGLSSITSRRGSRRGRGTMGSCPSDENVDEAEAAERATWAVTRGGTGGTPIRGGARRSSSGRRKDGRGNRDAAGGAVVDLPRSSSPALSLQQARGKLQQSGAGIGQPRLQTPAPSSSPTGPSSAVATNGGSQPITATTSQIKTKEEKKREGSIVQSFLESVCDQCNVGTTTSQAGETVADLYHNNIAPSFDSLAHGLHSMMSYGGSVAGGEENGDGGEDEVMNVRAGGEGGVAAERNLERASGLLPTQPQQQQQHMQRYSVPQESERQLTTEEELLLAHARLVEEADRYEAMGDNASALVVLEQCLRLSIPSGHSTSNAHNSAVGVGAPSTMMGALSVPSLESGKNGNVGGTTYAPQPIPESYTADVLYKIGTIHWKTGSYDEALERLAQALAIHRRTLIVTPLSTHMVFDESSGRNMPHNDEAAVLAEVLNSIGRVHFSLGDYDQAMRHYSESLAVQTKVYADFINMTGFGNGGGSSGVVAASTSQEADLLSFSDLETSDGGGNSITASGTMSPPLSPENPTRKRRKAAIGHPDVARTTIAMGMVYEARGRDRRAMRFFQDGLKAQRWALGNDHVDVAATLNAVGTLHEKKNEYDQAITCFEEALTVYRNQLGHDHPDVAVTLNNIGHHRFRLGDFDGAMDSYNEALRIMTESLGEYHRNVASTMHNIARVYSSRGQHDDALNMYRRVLRNQRAALGDSHLDVAVTLDSVASAFEGQGRYDRAAKHYVKALRVRRSALGRDHLFVGYTLDRLGTFHMERDHNYDGAVRRLQEAREVYAACSLGEDDATVVGVVSRLETALLLRTEESLN